MEKQLMVTVPNAKGEEGLTIACRRGELFRNDAALERFYKQGYRVHNYSVVNEKMTSSAEPETIVKVVLTK